MVKNYPFIPEAFGKNKPGMQSDQNLDSDSNIKATHIWENAISSAITYAEEMNDIGVHKQHANRLLESFCFYTGVITGTEWTNFYKLRMHKDAQPEFQKLAQLMYDAQNDSVPVKRDFHLPYADKLIETMGIQNALNVSAARCARVSYKTFDGKESKIDDDLRLCNDLISGGHMSPFDQQAFADTTQKINNKTFWSTPRDHRQYWGWIPNRVYIERKYNMIQSRNSYDPIETQ